MAVVLETERLVVRELEEGDLPFLIVMLGDPETMAFWPRPYTPLEAAEWIVRHRARYASDGCGYWLLSLSDGTPIGQVGVLRQEFEWPQRQRPFYWGLGYILHHPYWGHGYATEAVRGCVEWAFAHQETDSLVALIRPENERSAALARRLGMAVEGEVQYSGFAHQVFVLAGQA